MFVEIPPKLSISSFMEYLKGKNAIVIAKYIDEQLTLDKIDLFTGNK